jgi:hypothetical protein
MAVGAAAGTALDSALPRSVGSTRAPLACGLSPSVANAASMRWRMRRYCQRLKRMTPTTSKTPATTRPS